MMFGRFRAGLSLAKGSFAVLRREPWLLAFPVMYGLTWGVGVVVFLLLALAALVGTGLGLAVVDAFLEIGSGDVEVVIQGVALVIGFLFMVFAAAVSTYFTAALVYCVGKTFEGESVGARDGLSAAWQHKRTILVWGLVSAIIGQLLRLLRGRNERIGRIVQTLFGAAWAVATFFIVPVIVFEGTGVRASFRRSLSIMREQWGEAVGIHLGIGIVFVPLVAIALLGGIVGPIALLESPTPLIYVTGPIAVAIVVVLVMVYVATTAIAKTALYHYATGGALPEELDVLDPDDLAVRRRGMTDTRMGI